MCLHPIPIKNLNKGLTNKGKEDPNYYKDCKNTYIGVPCGWCSECIALKQMSYVQRIIEEAQFYEIFMIMYSYNEEMIPRVKYNGYEFKYADIQDFVKMVKRLRKWKKEENKEHTYLPWDFKYFGVTELGGKRGRPHFHIFIMVSKEVLKCRADCMNAEKTIWKVMLENWQRNVGSTKKPIYKNLCTYTEKWDAKRQIMTRNYDCQWVERNALNNNGEDAVWYMMKYALKDSGKERRRQQALKLNLPQEEYLNAWETIRTRAFYSKYFGLDAREEFKNPFDDIGINPKIAKNIRKGIELGKGKFPFPIWINQNNGRIFVLSEYYKKYFYMVRDMNLYFIHDEQKRLEIQIKYRQNKTEHFKRKTHRDQEIWNEHNLSNLDYILEQLNK